MAGTSFVSGPKKGGVRSCLKRLLSRGRICADANETSCSSLAKMNHNADQTLTARKGTCIAPSLVRSDSHDTESSDDTHLSFTSSTSANRRESALRIKTQAESLLSTIPTCKSAGRTDARNVGFSKVTNHFHTLVMGDHPEVVKGVPVALGDWESSSELSVASYEEERERRYQCSNTLPWECRTRLSAKARQNMLLEAGVSFQCIQQRIHRIKVQNNMALRKRILASQSSKPKRKPCPCDSSQ